VHHGQDHWWVLATISLSLGRDLLELTGGRGYLRRGDRLLADPGWDAPPQPADSAAIAAADLRERPVLELIRAAGLHARPARPAASVVVLIPASRASGLLRRAMDLRLHATFRPVQLDPLFTTPPADDDAAGQARGSLIEVRLEAAGHAGQQGRPVPEALISALDADPDALVCRAAAAQLLVQHGRHAPLTDRQLAAFTGDATWVLADPPHGCWSLRPLKDFAPAGSLVRPAAAHQLGPGDPSWPDPGARLPEPAELKIVPARGGGPVDALLLDDADLAGLPPLLEGHPLAEFAAVVPGRDRHLLLASGGIVDRIPIGEYLACVGPGPVYLAHGWRTEPLLPAAAWRDLISHAPGVALVLEPDRTLAFDLRLRRPVWELWAGDLPPLDAQLPGEAEQLLAGIDEQLRPKARPDGPQATDKAGERGPRAGQRGVRGLVERLRAGRGGRRTPDWREQALAAEIAGDLVAAAKLHDQHGEPDRAARLYERAAFEGSAPAGQAGS
jgi:hypothetical protein